ncbi:uncharacterized protein trim25l [Gadus morhua]|uniref:uncharacterized protein trim25l n=1 Tax=Gadus morhua TaxID=8049 RepID=UPI0011B6A1A7|nr:uncharacterized protein LOC115541780 [Gadus morhua]
MSGKLWTEEQFNCPVCLDLPSEPATIPCGHSYCMGCIRDYWSEADATGTYSCPQCRQAFSPKPHLSRNTMLAEAVEQLRTGAALGPEQRASIRSTRGAGAGKAKRRPSSSSSSAVPCDMCTGQKQRAAVKSCLVCMSSYCESHLKHHQGQKSMRQHELIGPTGQLAQKICTEHKYLQEFYCRPCGRFVCWLCTSNQHKGHECVSTKAERVEKQKVLTGLQAENHQRLQERERELKEMTRMMEIMKHSAERVRTDAELVLSELRCSVERLQTLVEAMLERAELDKMAEAREVADSLAAEVKERKRREEEMKDLVRCEDHIHYLQTCEELASPLELEELPGVLVNLEASFDPAREAILDLREHVEDLCNAELGKITKKVNDTSLFTLEGSNSNRGAKGGFLRLFSGLGARTAASRPTGLVTLRFYNHATNCCTVHSSTCFPAARPSATSPSVSVGARTPDRRGIGLDVRGRDPPRGSSPRPQDGPRRENRGLEAARESNSRRPSPRSSPTLSRRESESEWNGPRQTQPSPPAQPDPPRPTAAAAAAVTPAPVPAPVRAASPAQAFAGSFSRMSSISSLFRSHRRGNAQATPVPDATPPASSRSGPSFRGGNPWGIGTLSETPTEVNPGLFLDSPSPDFMPNDGQVFPALREINLDSIQAPEPRGREEFLQYAVQLTLDPDTAHRRLALSDGDTKATLQAVAAPGAADAPRRFDGWTQALSRGPLGGAGRSYWEVEWRGRGSSVGVAYGSLARKGGDGQAGLGYNARSWSLELSDTRCVAMHDNERRDIAVGYSPRVGVFLDPAAGTLGFYSVADGMSHLHTFRANFTRPLYAAVGVGVGVGVGMDFALGQFSSSADSVKLCPM